MPRMMTHNLGLQVLPDVTNQLQQSLCMAYGYLKIKHPEYRFDGKTYQR